MGKRSFRGLLQSPRPPQRRNWADSQHLNSVADPPDAASVKWLHGLEMGGHLLLCEPKTGREWYADTGELVDHHLRPCHLCGRAFDACGECAHTGPHDPCVGHLAGAADVCCGHGDTESAYIWWEDGSEARGRKALRVMSRLGPRRLRWPLPRKRRKAPTYLRAAVAQLAVASSPHADPGLLEALGQITPDGSSAER